MKEESNFMEDKGPKLKVFGHRASVAVMRSSSSISIHVRSVWGHACTYQFSDKKRRNQLITTRLETQLSLMFFAILVLSLSSWCFWIHLFTKTETLELTIEV